MSKAIIANEPSKWELLGERELARTAVFEVVQRRLRNPSNGKEGEFSVIKARNWVVAMAEVRPGHYAMVTQYRFGSDELSLEFPAGCLDGDEDPLLAAARELEEESGYRPLSAGRILGKVHPNPALQDNTCWFVLFDNVEQTGRTDFDPFEEMSCCVLPIDEILRRARDGHISHGMIHAALFFLTQSER